MFKFVAILAFATFVNAGFIPSATIVHHEPVVAKVGAIVHSAPSAVSHQSITQVHNNNAIVQPVLAPVVKSTVHVAPVAVHAAPIVPVVKTVHHAATPVVHSAAVVKTYAAPVLKTYASPVVPVVKTLHASPIVHTVPVVKTVHAVPLVHAAPVVKTYLH